MLNPNKHSHPDQTVVAAATSLLRTLRRYRVVRFDELKDALKLKGTGGDYLFIPAVSLLHILGLVEYRGTADAFEYTGKP